MKYLVIILSMYVMHTTCAVNTTIVVPEMCENITRRTYLISRLERTMLALKKFNPNYASIFIDQAFFKHPDLIAAVSLINTHNSLDPMFDLWDKLKEYKNINDFLLIQEFTKLILFIPSCINGPKVITKQIKTDINLSLEGTTYIEAVTLRRYYAERLKKAIAFLHYVPCIKTDFFEKEKPGCDCSFITNYEFSHAEIKKIIESMHQENNLTPIVRLAGEFNNLKLINDSDFQKQFMVLIFTTYRNLIINNASKYQYTLKKSTLETIAHLYENVEKIPLEQILDAIDLLAQELPIILGKYEFNNAKISWKSWFYKYWWMTSLALTSLGYKVMRIFYPYKLSAKPTSPNKPRPTSTGLLKDDELP